MERDDEVAVPESDAPAPAWKRAEVREARSTLTGLIVAYACAALLYRGLIKHDLGHTAVMFIGLPVLLACLLAMVPPARTSTGAIMKGITLFLLLVAPLMGEGYLCILIASPLFYLVGAIVATFVNVMRDRRENRMRAWALLLLPLCFEGVVPVMSFPREQAASTTRVIVATPDEIAAALAAPPRMEQAMPRLLRIGFPRPVFAGGSGLQVGSVRLLHFTGAETAPPGDLLARVSVSRPGYALFDVVSDHTKVTEWMHWRSSEVAWQAVDTTHTRVTWTIHYSRGLDPAWYFGPWERVVVATCADYLITASATPGAK